MSDKFTGRVLCLTVLWVLLAQSPALPLVEDTAVDADTAQSDRDTINDMLQSEIEGTVTITPDVGRGAVGDDVENMVGSGMPGMPGSGSGEAVVPLMSGSSRNIGPQIVPEETVEMEKTAMTAGPGIMPPRESTTTGTETILAMATADADETADDGGSDGSDCGRGILCPPGMLTAMAEAMKATTHGPTRQEQGRTAGPASSTSNSGEAVVPPMSDSGRKVGPQIMVEETVEIEQTAVTATGRERANGKVEAIEAVETAVSAGTTRARRGRRVQGGGADGDDGGESSSDDVVVMIGIIAGVLCALITIVGIVAIIRRKQHWDHKREKGLDWRHPDPTTLNAYEARVATRSALSAGAEQTPRPPPPYRDGFVPTEDNATRSGSIPSYL